MATVTPTIPPQDSSPGDMMSVGDVLAHLGDISADRIPLGFPIGSATEEDLLNLLDHSNRICELIDGVLVEKVMSTRESLLAGYVIYLFQVFIESNDLGFVTAPDGALRLLPGQVRVPDVAFIRWDRLPGKRLPHDPIFAVAPSIAVEILSPSNTRREMARKLADYFSAGVQLVWYIDPETRTAQAFEAVDRLTNYAASDEIPAGDVLPGFSLSLAKLFAQLDRQG